MQAKSLKSDIQNVQNALDLYLLRSVRLGLYWVGSFGLQNIERRLREALDPILQAPLPHEIFPSLYDESLDVEETANNWPDEARAALFLIHHLHQGDEIAKAKAYQRAYYWLGESSNPVLHAAAKNVLTLYPVPLQEDTIIKLCDTYEPSLMIPVWQSQQLSIPQAWLQPDAEVWSLDYPASKRNALLQWVGHSPQVDNDTFTAIVRPQIHHASLERLPIEQSAVVIKAMLVRGLGTAAESIAKLLDCHFHHPEYYRIVECAALSGRTEYTTEVMEFPERDPERGIPLLAVFGHKASAMRLLTYLQDPTYRVLAAEAWHLLTGQYLPRRTLLHSVGSESGPKKPPRPNMQTVPDVDQALAWWAKNKGGWSDEQRWLYGLVPQINVAHNVLYHSAGKQADLLLDILAYLRRKPHGLSSLGWFTDQREKLTSCKDPTAKNPIIELQFK